jgi:hypothetical protein
MTRAPDADDLPRAATAAVADALLAVDALLTAARQAGRAVRYTLEDDATPLTREEIEAWLVGAEAEGLTHVRYRVAPDAEGVVAVSMGAVEPQAPQARPAAARVRPT